MKKTRGQVEAEFADALRAEVKAQRKVYRVHKRWAKFNPTAAPLYAIRRHYGL